MPQWLPGPRVNMVLLCGGPNRLDNYTWKRNDLTRRRGIDGHLDGHILEPRKNQFGQSPVLHFLGGPEQLQVLVPRPMVVLVDRVHSGLRKANC